MIQTEVFLVGDRSAPVAPARRSSSAMLSSTTASPPTWWRSLPRCSGGRSEPAGRPRTSCSPSRRGSHAPRPGLERGRGAGWHYDGLSSGCAWEEAFSSEATAEWIPRPPSCVQHTIAARPLRRPSRGVAWAGEVIIDRSAVVALHCAHATAPTRGTNTLAGSTSGSANAGRSPAPRGPQLA
jgi:hypothetical protein